MIVKFFTQIGCAVQTTSQGYRKEKGGTRMSPGIPDLIVWLPSGKQGWFEVKTDDGLALWAKLVDKPEHAVAKSQRDNWKRIQGQAAFARRCIDGGIPYGRGTLTDAHAWAQAKFP